MRRTRRSGGFFLCLLLNLLLNWEGVIPAALLFALHRWRGWPLWWAGLALALWIGGILLWMRQPPRRPAGEQESLLL